MQWSDDYSVGIAEIDEQHQVLIQMISELEMSIVNPDPKQRWSVIHYAIVRLADYVRVHFAVEEALMRILKFPALDSHVAQHRGFVNYLHDLERRSVTHDVTESEITDFLNNWLGGHIKHDDRHYADYFRTAFDFSSV